jgi:hypothetical protein
MKRVSYALIGLILGGISLLLHYFYRPFIYENDLYDFHFANVFPSLFATPAIVFFYFGLSKEQTLKNKIIISAYIGSVLYELLSLTGMHKTFDILDIVALTVSMILLLLLPDRLRKKVQCT